MKALLEDLVPPKGRQVLYLILAVGAAAYSVWQGAEGDWLTFIGGLFTTFSGSLAAGNVNTATPTLVYPED